MLLTQKMTVLNVAIIPVLPLHCHVHSTSYVAIGKWDGRNNVTWINSWCMPKGQQGKTVQPCTYLQFLCRSQEAPALINWVFLLLAQCFYCVNGKLECFLLTHHSRQFYASPIFIIFLSTRSPKLSVSLPQRLVEVAGLWWRSSDVQICHNGSDCIPKQEMQVSRGIIIES